MRTTKNTVTATRPELAQKLVRATIPETTIASMAGPAAAYRALGFGHLLTNNTPPPGPPVLFTEEELETNTGLAGALTLRALLEIQRDQINRLKHYVLPSVHRDAERWALANNRIKGHGVEVPRGGDLDNFVINYANACAYLLKKYGTKGVSENAVARAKAYGNVIYPDPTHKRPNDALYEMIEKQPEVPRVYVMGNGSHFSGSRQDDLHLLFSRLETLPLDITRLALYGFADLCPVSCQTRAAMYAPGFVQFEGNFLKLSAGFDIVTNDREVIQALESAIERNVSRQQREDF